MDILQWETVTYLYILPLLSIFGIVTNVISLVVLRSRTLKESAYIYLKTLSIANILILLFTSALAFVRCGTKCTRQSITDRFAKKIYEYFFYLPVANLLATFSQLLATAIAIERFVAVKFPMKSKLLCTKKTARRVISLIIFFSCLMNVPRFFIYKPVVIKLPDKLLTWCNSHNDTCVLYTPIDYEKRCNTISDDDFYNQLTRVFYHPLSNCSSSVANECRLQIRNHVTRRFDFNISEFYQITPVAQKMPEESFSFHDTKTYKSYSNEQIIPRKSQSNLFGFDNWRGVETIDDADHGTYFIQYDFDGKSGDFNKKWSKRRYFKSNRWTRMFWCLQYRSLNCIESDAILIHMNITKQEEVVIKQRFDENFADDYSVLMITIFALPMILSTFFNAALIVIIHQANTKLRHFLKPSLPAIKLGMFIRAREQHRLTVSVVCITITWLADNIFSIPLYTRFSKLFYGPDYANTKLYRISVLVGNTFSIFHFSTLLFFYAFFNHKFRRELKFLAQNMHNRCKRIFDKINANAKTANKF